MNLLEITDDLTGAVDSGSYFTLRGQSLTICTSGGGISDIPDGEILSVNLSSRNAEPEIARKRHYEFCRRLEPPRGTVMKKIGTGFRGNDGSEFDGILSAWDDSLIFLVDHAPDLNTFTLYGHQYCEGQILNKSLYARDPVLPPTESFIPRILSHGTDIPVALVDIDAVKGPLLLKATEDCVASGARILVFDAITRFDAIRILQALQPAFPRIIWAGSLGIADALGEFLFGPAQPRFFPSRDIRCLGFTASSFNATQRQLAFSAENGLRVIYADIDGYIEGDDSVPDRTAEETLGHLRHGNALVAPRVQRYSLQRGTSMRILECIRKVAALVCPAADFDRLVVIGGETSQVIFQELNTGHLRLGQPLEVGAAQGVILDGVLAGREFALKGGSMGGRDSLEKMMCRKDVYNG